MAGRRRGPSFYARALAPEQQDHLEQARDLEGLDEEIAVLRTLVLTALEARPPDIPQLLKLTELLVKAVAARARITGKRQDELPEAVAGVIQRVREVLSFDGQEGVPWNETSGNEGLEGSGGVTQTAP
jgi:hypothetical protein